MHNDLGVHYELNEPTEAISALARAVEAAAAAGTDARQRARQPRQCVPRAAAGRRGDGHYNASSPSARGQARHNRPGPQQSGHTPGLRGGTPQPLPTSRRLALAAQLRRRRAQPRGRTRACCRRRERRTRSRQQRPRTAPRRRGRGGAASRGRGEHLRWGGRARRRAHRAGRLLRPRPLENGSAGFVVSAGCDIASDMRACQ